jgi:hypothetical protein
VNSDKEITSIGAASRTPWVARHHGPFLAFDLGKHHVVEAILSKDDLAKVAGELSPLRMDIRKGGSITLSDPRVTSSSCRGSGYA